MALKLLSAALMLGLVTAACDGPAPPVADEREVLSVTQWSETSELFAEYPALAVAETSRFAIHLTRLDSFKPVTEGRVEVHLSGAASPTETFYVEGPSRPGIFGVDVKPVHAGKRQLAITLGSSSLRDAHVIGEVDVHPNAQAATAARDAEDATPGISFLKEQQWTLDFATAIVREQTVQESIRVPARLEPRPGGAAAVVAPIGGRLTTVMEVPLGRAVTRGQELARLLPSPAVPGDQPQLQRAQAEARSALAQATRDRERAERLTTAGAAPERRLEDARAAEQQASARLIAAEASLAQHNAARSGSAANELGFFSVRAPVSGVVAERDAVTGANVPPGAILFRIVDASAIHVVGQIPEALAPRAGRVSAAELEVPGRQERWPVGHPVSIGKVIDAQARTLPITFALDNRALGLPVGQAVFLHLLTTPAAPRPVVPAAAVVDDAGQSILFVQREGETFERRAVTLGARSGDLVQVIAGLESGERVVTKGAYLVRLAALSTTVPAHGHVH